jgi:NADPH-dependent ferric siderophore reductase
VWLAGDEAALPAIAALLEGLPPGIAASVFVELDEPVDLALLASRADTEVRFALRGTDPDAGDLVQLLKKAPVPTGPGEVWLAAEAGVARAARAFLASTRGLSAARIHSVGYWKHGARDHKDLAAG